MSELLQLLSSLAVTLTVCMFLSGIPSCIEIVKQRSVGNVPFLPFITTEVNALLWISYGVLTSNWTLIICNTIGLIFQACYIIIFITFAKRKTKPIQETCIALAFLLAVYFYLTRFVANNEALINQLGLLGASLTMLMYTSPLAELFEIIRLGDASSISTPLTITQLCSSSAWFSFGLLLNDAYIYFPNVPGIISCFVRIFLIYKYSRDDTAVKKRLDTKAD